MDLNFRVGPQTLGDGSEHQARSGRTGEAIVGDAHAKYYESVVRGKCFSGATAKTGVAPGTDTGTTSSFTLYNPKSSGYNLVVLEASMGYISGTLGAGTVFYVVNKDPAAAAVTGTAITVVNNLIGGAAGVGLLFTTATLPAAPTIARPFVSLTALLASTAVAPYIIKDLLDGEFVIAPGCALSLEAVAAGGSTPLVVYGMTWEEVPV